MHTNNSLHVHQLFGVPTSYTKKPGLQHLSTPKMLVCTCENTKNFGVNSKKYVKSKDNGVQGGVHHILWCVQLAYTKI
jgi:hypothetical protein